MKSLAELQTMSKEERFAIIFNFVTTSLKNETVVDIMKKAIGGIQDSEVLSFSPALIVSELAAKGYLGKGQDECLKNFCKVS